jgi:hypothetical protein
MWFGVCCREAGIGVQRVERKKRKTAAQPTGIKTYLSTLRKTSSSVNGHFCHRIETANFGRQLTEVNAASWDFSAVAVDNSGRRLAEQADADARSLRVK